MPRVAKNGHGPTATDDQLKKAARLNVRRQTTYAFPDHTVVTVQAVAAPLVYDLQSDAGKPVPQKMKEIVMFGGGVTRMPDTDDPDYKDAIREWELSKAVRYARTMILQSVKEWPPDDAIRYWSSVGFNDPVDIKYNWIAAKLNNQALETDFYETIMGLSVPTEEGLEVAEETFPGNGESVGQTVEVPEPVAAATVEEEPAE